MGGLERFKMSLELFDSVTVLPIKLMGQFGC
jgi:hypothetical protein